MDYAKLFHNEYTARLVLALSVSITVFGWSVASRYENARAEESFIFEVEDAQQKILYRMLTYEQALRGGVALFNASNVITRDEWRSYVESLHLEQTLPGIQGFGYSERIRLEELSRHEASIREEGFPSYLVRPSGERSFYAPIVFLEPFDYRNRRAFGFDMYSDSIRRAAMEQAMLTGSTSLSGIVKLQQETDKDVQAGFLMYLPVYKKGMPTETEQQRVQAIQGFVYSPFRAKDLMLGVLGNNAIPLTFQLYDGDQIDPDTLLYDSRTVDRQLETTPKNFRPKYTSHASLMLPGRSWTIDIQSTPVFEEVTKSIQPELILIAGGVIDILLFLVINSLARQRRILFHRNREMEVIQSRFESLVNGLKGQFAFFSMTAQGKLEYYSTSLCRFLGLENVDESKLFESTLDSPESVKKIKAAIDQSVSTRKISGFSLVCSTKESLKTSNLVGLISPTINAKGDIISLEGVLQDDTERFLQEQELNDYRKNLEQIVKDRTLRLEQANKILLDNDKRMQSLIELAKLVAEVSKDSFIKSGIEVSRKLFDSDGCFLLEVDSQFNPQSLFVDTTVSGFQHHNLLGVECPWSQLFANLFANGVVVIRQNNLTDLFGHLSPIFCRVQHVMMCISRERNSRAFILGVTNQTESYSIQSENQINLFLEDFSRLIFKTEVTEELKKAKASAELASQAKRMFLANMSHEIRTPLNAIMGLNILLLDDEMPDSQRKMLQHMQTSSKHLLAVLESILDFSRIDTGIVELERIDFDPKAVFRSTCELLENTASEKGLKLILELDDRIPRLINGDPTRFNQVVTNLVSNAIKFSDKGKVVASLILESKSQDSVILNFEVLDEGIGFDQDRFSSLLQPFEQADNSHARRFGGTGLGLAIVNKLIGLMDGQLTVKSQPGKGSLFKATMRLKMVSDASNVMNEDLAREDSEYWIERFKGKHILVVDDNFLNRTVVEALLHRVGVQTSAAEDGIYALVRPE